MPPTPTNIRENDILMDLPGRHPDLPQLYRTESHPLVPNKSDGNIYFYVQDLSKAAMKKCCELEKRLRIPHGPESLAIKRGGHLFCHFRRFPEF
jgi:hypothetical protein